MSRWSDPEPFSSICCIVKLTMFWDDDESSDSLRRARSRARFSRSLSESSSERCRPSCFRNTPSSLAAKKCLTKERPLGGMDGNGCPVMVERLICMYSMKKSRTQGPVSKKFPDRMNENFTNINIDDKVNDAESHVVHLPIPAFERARQTDEGAHDKSNHIVEIWSWQLVANNT